MNADIFDWIIHQMEELGEDPTLVLEDVTGHMELFNNNQNK